MSKGGTTPTFSETSRASKTGKSGIISSRRACTHNQNPHLTVAQEAMFACADIMQLNMSQRKIAGRKLPIEMINAVLNEETEELMEYRQVMKNQNIVGYMRQNIQGNWEDLRKKCQDKDKESIEFFHCQKKSARRKKNRYYLRQSSCELQT